MNLEEMLESRGFRLSASCAGKAAYTKFVKHGEKRAYISLTSLGGDSVPTTLDEPVRVMVYDLRSGDELDAGKEFVSLQAFLDSLGE